MSEVERQREKYHNTPSFNGEDETKTNITDLCERMELRP
jgi:hypothetical protein